MKNGNMEWVTVTDTNFSEIAEKHLPMNRSLLEAAYRYGATIESCSSLNLFRATVGEQTEYIQGSGTSLNSLISRHISKKKQITNFLLDDMGVIPDWCMLTSDEYAASGTSHINNSMFPVVVKPTNELQGKGVIVNIKNRKQLEKACERSFKKYKKIIIQKFLADLKEYRVTVIDGTVVGVLERVHAYVIGDGKKTLQELIDEKNSKRLAVQEIEYKPIEIDRALFKQLKKKEYTLESIPEKNEHVRLKGVCSMSAGGEIIDRTAEICTENSAIAVEATERIQLRMSGVDFICENISESLHNQRGGILEVNIIPDISMHHHPTEGKAQDMATPMIKALFK